MRAKGVYGPFLIIAPLSTLTNWASEVTRWCPSMPVLAYHGNGAKARAALRAEHMPQGERRASAMRMGAAAERLRAEAEQWEWCDSPNSLRGTMHACWTIVM